MRNDTRKLFDTYQQRIAQLNGVTDPTKTFTAEPSVQQTLETKMQESSEFLGRINLIPVDELKGEKIGLGVGSTIASRTDTTTKSRQPRSVGTLDADGYECRKTDFDTFVKYQQLDAWAKFPDFQTRLANAILQRQALDRITIGFNGTSAAADTDRAAHPLLQDVNIGWLQQYRTHAPARVMDHGAVAGKVSIGGAAGDYKNLDALVFDAITLLDPWYQRSPELVVLTGRELIHDKYFPLVNRDQAATDTLATDVILAQRRIGGLQTFDVPYIPAGTLLITSFANLSLYWQVGGRRRHIVEEPQNDRITNYESSNDAYVVEDYGFGAVVENIEVAE